MTDFRADPNLRPFQESPIVEPPEGGSIASVVFWACVAGIVLWTAASIAVAAYFLPSIIEHAGDASRALLALRSGKALADVPAASFGPDAFFVIAAWLMSWIWVWSWAVTPLGIIALIARPRG